MLFLHRSEKDGDNDARRLTVARFHAAHLLNTWAMGTFRTLLTGFITMDQILLIISLFLVIRMNISIHGVFVPFFLLGIGGMCYFALKVALDFAGKLMQLSEEFCHPSGLRGFNKEEKCRLASCKPLRIVVGNTFTITRQTFSTISQDIVLANVINLLVGY